MTSTTVVLFTGKPAIVTTQIISAGEHAERMNDPEIKRRFQLTLERVAEIFFLQECGEPTEG